MFSLSLTDFPSATEIILPVFAFSLPSVLWSNHD